ncbi:ThuA domain-containing protein [Streptomyces sp. NPDC050504]|uniref:ThuA domain-containing protein n=1 Tax=Streptomyces sp. NPDC050504 TaxID=3365618 RepID=UPI0037B8B495
MHRRRPRVPRVPGAPRAPRASRTPGARKALALLTGALLAATTLAAAPTALAAPTTPTAAMAPTAPTAAMAPTAPTAPTDRTAATAAAAAASAAEEFQQVTLAKGADETGEPMSLAVLPDRGVLHTSRNGELRLTDAAGNTRVVGSIPVYTHDEEGLQGIGVDPDFTRNRAIYLYYAPPLETPQGDAPSDGTAADFAKFDGVNRLSRFTLNADGTLDNASEKKVIDVPATRGICCHVGGDIDFDAQGNLYLSTGDDSNPFASDGYTPIDERPTRNPAYDARRTSGNTNDLRGKILRIKVAADGGYTVPTGNLFAPGTARTRPEIYAMGFRNPFRFSVDKPTGVLYVGDYGPDAGAADPKRGPAGQVEFARVTKPGNFGWPLCAGDNQPYVDYDFATKTSGAAFDCTAPKNDSPHNTGLTDLPPAEPAWIPYDGGSVPEFGTGSESPMAGPVYRYDPANTSPVKFPEAYDGDFFAGEFGRRWIKRIEHDATTGAVRKINPFPWTGTQVMDSAFGPDGALYVLDYGTAWFGGDENSALYRIENATGGRSPLAQAAATKTSGTAPLTTRFSSAGTTDADGDALTYRWDFGDGTGSTAADPGHRYTRNGTYTATLTAKDPSGRTGSASVRVVVGNTAPTVTLQLPGDGQLFNFGDEVPFKVRVTDPEDGKAVDCAKVTVRFVLGHDSHGHPVTTAKGCTGTLKTASDGGHDPNANIFGVVDAEYTDGGGGGQQPLTSRDQAVLQQKQRQAEHYSKAQGVSRIDKPTAHGGKTVGDVHDGDWIAFTPYRIGDARLLTARVSSGGAGGTLEIRAGSPTGRLVGSATVPVTGGWEKFQDVSTPVSNPPSGTTTLYLVFRGTGTGALYDVDDFTFTTGPRARHSVLVFSKTADFRHDAIPAGVQSVRELGAANGFSVTATEDAAAFTAAGLARYDAVVFLSTTGDVLNTAQQSAFEAYVRDGGGYVGVHAAADTEYDWPFYGDLVGARFKSHPAVQRATVRSADSSHPATAHLPATWSRTDEWYDYRANPRGDVHVLATLDESSYTGGSMGADHPIAWCRNHQGGRSFYTGLGHTAQSYAEPAFRGHLLGGIQWATGAVGGYCGPEKGYTSLFDGRATTGWKQAGPGAFTTEGGELRTEGGMGLLWHEKEYGSYSLKLDWKVAGDDNSGIFIGFPPSDDPWSAVNKGYEIQIDATDAPDRTTGSVYGVQSADTAARDRALRPPGQWNSYEIKVQGERLRVYLNGALINDFTNKDPARSLRQGHIGLQNHGADDRVSFRDIRIKAL